MTSEKATEEMTARTSGWVARTVRAGAAPARLSHRDAVSLTRLRQQERDDHGERPAAPYGSLRR